MCRVPWMICVGRSAGDTQPRGRLIAVNPHRRFGRLGRHSKIGLISTDRAPMRLPAGLQKLFRPAHFHKQSREFDKRASS